METKNLIALQQTIKALRGEGGCPWDKKQTAKSLIKYIKAETAELIEAIEKGDIDNTCEELGDVLYLVLMISSIYDEARLFSIDDVARIINDKLIRRHPHVFAGTSYNSEEDLNEQWESIKKEEKREKANRISP